MQVKNNTQKSLQLISEGLNVIGDNEIYLIDDQTFIKYNLKRDEIYVPGLINEKKYTILIGNQDFISEQTGNFIPASFELFQNYPNPFNPSTRIYFNNPSSGRIKIDIYNLLGEKVYTVTDNFYEAGNFSVVWNGVDDNNNTVSSGVYFYSLQSGDVRIVKKMILNR
jgi:hypothetical protein